MVSSLSLPYWWYLSQNVSLDYSPSHFALQACFRNFFLIISCLWKALSRFKLYCWYYDLFFSALSVLDCRKCFKVGVVCISIRLNTYMSWTQTWILPAHKSYYCLGSYYAPLSCFLAQRMLSHCSLIRFCVCQKNAVIILKLCLFETGK